MYDHPMAVLLTLALANTLLLGFLLSLLFVRYSVFAARRYSILAHPSSRGSHEHPTPRLGGLGFATAFLVTFVLTFVLMRGWRIPISPFIWNAAIVIGGGYALIGGLLDDVLELPPRWKLLFQAAAAGSAVLIGLHFTQVALANGTVYHLNPAVAAALAFLFIVFIMNAYNFMDGMDGQAALFGFVVTIGIITPLASGVGPRMLIANLPEILIMSTLGGVLAGFLTFNMPGTSVSIKSFMGDSGSQFVGFLLAITTVRLAQKPASSMPAAAAVILLAPFMWDVLYTLARRLARRENVLLAHRSHLYQRLLISGWSHKQTLTFNMLLWLACLACSQGYAAAHNARRPEFALLYVAAALLALVLYTVTVWVVEARHRRKRFTEGQKVPAGTA
jgi:UDP-N-acetylmuramyl pentapeptide phosphotransferase/UDP-N-acetylglucosamine-1-phosphate transferase